MRIHCKWKFESALSTELAGLIDADLVHVLWGMSKDFGDSGVRVGAIISQSNRALLDAVRTASLYSCSSSFSDLVTTDILEDTGFADFYIWTKQQRLCDAYTFAARTLKTLGIDCAPGVNAAFFLWINLGKAYLDKHPEESADVAKLNIEGEATATKGQRSDLTAKIYAKLMDKKVFLAGGDVTGAEEPGWFRLVFSQPRDYLEEGLRRIVEAI